MHKTAAITINTLLMTSLIMLVPFGSTTIYPNPAMAQYDNYEDDRYNEYPIDDKTYECRTGPFEGFFVSSVEFCKHIKFDDKDDRKDNRVDNRTGTQGYPPKKPILDSLQTEGTFFVSDAGQSHGGFEFTAEYNAEFDVTNGIGTLTLTQIIGLGDPLEKHVYSITDLQIDKNKKITMKIDDNPVELVFVESDEIWNHQYDNHYIASWGGFAPENEIKGIISPTIFPGLPDFWYVELRIPAAY
jgi:hypothetical protein